MILLLLLFPSLAVVVLSRPVNEEEWELIGSRTYEWDGSDLLRCKHWDKVAVRWHLSKCNHKEGKRRCTGGSNADMATISQNYTELPRWRNAFTYVQLPGQEHKDEHLKLAMDGYDYKLTKLKSISPLKMDVDWKWTVDKNGCNHFSVRMSAMSTIEKHRLGELNEFCNGFDRDGFVTCNNL